MSTKTQKRSEERIIREDRLRLAGELRESINGLRRALTRLENGDLQEAWEEMEDCGRPVHISHEIASMLEGKTFCRHRTCGRDIPRGGPLHCGRLGHDKPE